MAERLTKTGARNVFYGGSIFFFAIFVGPFRPKPRPRTAPKSPAGKS